MKKLAVITLCIIYSSLIAVTGYQLGKKSSVGEPVNTSNISVAEEEYYTAVERNGKLSLYKEGDLLMSLDTNVELLPAIVRSQLKKGVEFKASDLPAILEAFAE